MIKLKVLLLIHILKHKNKSNVMIYHSYPFNFYILLFTKILKYENKINTTNIYNMYLFKILNI